MVCLLELPALPAAHPGKYHGSLARYSVKPIRSMAESPMRVVLIPILGPVRERAQIVPIYMQPSLISGSTPHSLGIWSETLTEIRVSPVRLPVHRITLPCAHFDATRAGSYLVSVRGEPASFFYGDSPVTIAPSPTPYFVSSLLGIALAIIGSLALLAGWLARRRRVRPVRAWYKDPENPASEWYWNGSRWSSHRWEPV